MTTANSIASLLPADPPPLSQPEQDEQAVREALSAKAGTNRLTHLVAVDSLDRNLQSEDEAFAKFMNGKATPEDQDGMRILAAGPVTITNNLPAQQQPAAAATPNATPVANVTQADPPSGGQPAPAAPEQKAGTGWLTKAAIAAALLGTGAGGTALISQVFNHAAPAATQAIDSAWQLSSKVLDKP